MICVHCNTPIPEDSRFCLACGADTSDPGTGPRTVRNSTASDDLMTRLGAAVVDRYELQRLLGRGGMGAVFLGTDRKLERPVAIKVLPPEIAHDRNLVERFEREARTAAKLDHPNIIPIYSVESHGEFHYFVMKFVTGRSLEEILHAGPMPVDLAKRILWEAACALGHAHQRGIVHRDVKPANIMIDENGHTVVMDFGISKAVQSATHDLTATGQVVGTPHYMSPEQCKGVEVDGRSDQYSLAVVGYRMLTGTLPFSEDSIHAVLYKKIFEDPRSITELREDIPVHFADALHAALARDPSHRFGTMEDFASAIWPENPLHASGGVRSSARAVKTPIEGETQIAATQVQPRRRKSRATALFSALVVIGGGAGAGWWFVLRNPQASAEAQPAAMSAAAIDDSAQRVAAADSTQVDTGMTVAQRPPVQEPETTPTQQPASVRPETARPVQRPSQRTPAPEPAMGYLTINSDPFGSVYLDGVFIRETPLVRHALTPGPHIVEIRREGYVTEVDTVQITAENEVRSRKILVRVP